MNITATLRYAAELHHSTVTVKFTEPAVAVDAVIVTVPAWEPVM